MPNGGCCGNDGAAFALRTCLDRSIDLVSPRFIYTVALFFNFVTFNLVKSLLAYLIFRIVALFTGDIFISDGETLLFLADEYSC